MRWLVLYTALLIGANAGWAGEIDWQAAHDGGLAKLQQTDPTPVPATTFTDPEGGTHSLADYKGKVVLLNFWATWCAPCREEMPSLDALQAEMGGEDFAYVLQKIPGCMAFLGVAPEGHKDPESRPSLHHAQMTLEEQWLSRGVALHCAFATRFLARGWE